jgi:hypothetical protein
MADGRASANEQGRLGPDDATVRAYSEAYTNYGYDYAFFTKTMQVSKAHRAAIEGQE